MVPQEDTPKGANEQSRLSFLGHSVPLLSLRCLEAALLGHLHLCSFSCLTPFPGDHKQAGMRQEIWAPSLGLEGTGPERPPRAWRSLG